MQDDAVAAVLIARGPRDAAWVLFPALTGDMTKAFADELVEGLRSALYDNIRNRG